MVVRSCTFTGIEVGEPVTRRFFLQLKESDYRHPDPAELYPKVADGRLQPHPVPKRRM